MQQTQAVSPRRGGWVRKTPTAVIDGVEVRLSLDVIESLKNKGMNQTQIGKLFGVTRQAISWWIHTYNGALTKRAEILRAHWPFNTSTEHHSTSAARRLRDHAEFYATGGRGMSEVKIDRLPGFYRQLEDHVVVFDPALPPPAGVRFVGRLDVGATRTPRRPSHVSR